MRITRRTVLALPLLASLPKLQAQTLPAAYRWESLTPLNDGIRWPNVSPRLDGRPHFLPRDGAQLISYADKLWLVGGWSPGLVPGVTSNDVWSSADGNVWTQVKPNTFGFSVFNSATDWAARHTYGLVSYKGEIWIVGGDPNQGYWQTDVWSSSNGTNWQRRGDFQPQIVPRALYGVVVFKGRIWVLGGQTLTMNQDGQALNDVWSTTNGQQWTRHMPANGHIWSPRAIVNHAVVHQGRLWVVGGWVYSHIREQRSNGFNDVWSTADGVNWVLHASQSPWIPRWYGEAASFDGKLWMITGSTVLNGGNRDDAWYSDDGVNWTELVSTIRPGPRHASARVVHQGALHLACGNMWNDSWRLVPNYRYELEKLSGVSGLQTGGGAGLVVLNGQLIMAGGLVSGGSAYSNGVLRSSDGGIRWQVGRINSHEAGQAPSNVYWSGRSLHDMVVHNGFAYICGGFNTESDYLSDVWRSADGVTWSRIAAALPWGQRFFQGLVSFQNKLWLLGGQNNHSGVTPSSTRNVSPDVFYNDVWSSSDGVSWTRAQSNAPWQGRGMVNVVVFQDRLWLVGGARHPSRLGGRWRYFKDVWSSTDGINWDLETDHVPWTSRANHTVTVFDGKLWVLGGENNTKGRLSDVWHSADGVHWTSLKRPKSFWPRKNASAIVLNGQLLIVGGESAASNEVWRVRRIEAA